MSSLHTRISLFNWHFLHIIPTLFVFLITQLSKSYTKTTLGLRFCLLLPAVFFSYSGLLAFLSLHFLQILQMVPQDIHGYMTALQQQFLSCFLVTCLNNISYNFHALRINSFMVWGRQCILHSIQTQIKYKYTKLHINTLNIHRSNTYIHTHTHTHTHTYIYIYIYIYIHTGCPRRNVPDFGRMFLMLKYTDITQNTYVQS